MTIWMIFLMNPNQMCVFIMFCQLELIFLRLAFANLSCKYSLIVSLDISHSFSTSVEIPPYNLSLKCLLDKSYSVVLSLHSPCESNLPLFTRLNPESASGVLVDLLHWLLEVKCILALRGFEKTLAVQLHKNIVIEYGLKTRHGICRGIEESNQMPLHLLSTSFFSYI